jgi:hypothetical protein
MRERVAMPQAMALAQRVLDVRIRIEHALPAEQLDRVEKVSARPDRGVNIEAVLDPGEEVVRTVSRCSMHRARSLLERDVIRQDRN